MSNPTELGRRDFFKNAALGAAGLVGTTAAAGAADAAPLPARQLRPRC